MSEKALKIVFIVAIGYLALATVLGSCGANNKAAVNNDDLVPWAQAKDNEDEKDEQNAQDEQNEQLEQTEQNEQIVSEGNMEADMKDLVSLVYSEAENKSEKLNIAIAAVVINRVKSSGFPNSIKEVIYQPNQFISVCTNGLVSYENIPDDVRTQIENAVNSAMLGKDPTNGAFYYYSIKYGTQEDSKRIADNYHPTEIDGFFFLRELPN